MPPTPIPPTPTPDPIGTPPPDLGFVEVDVRTSCLAENGRFDIELHNPTDSLAQYEVEVGHLERIRSLSSRAETNVTVTGRADGQWEINVLRNGETVASLIKNVACDPQVETLVKDSCLALNGRIDAVIKNFGSSTATYAVFVGSLPARTRTVQPGSSSKVVVTGRPDGDLPVRILRNGSEIDAMTVSIDCDPNIEMLISNSCLGERGRVDVNLMNLNNATTVYGVTLTGLASRQRTLSPDASARVTFTGRRDGQYTASITRNGLLVHSENFTITC